RCSPVISIAQSYCATFRAVCVSTMAELRTPGDRSMERLIALLALVICLTTPAASAQTAGTTDVVIYASDISSPGLHGSWTTQSDATAANSMLLATPDAG